MFRPITKEEHKTKLAKLNPDEQAKYEDYVRLTLYINTNSKEEIDLLCKTLKPYTASDIYKFSLNSSVFKNLLIQNDSPLTVGWSKELKDKGFFGEAITSHTLYDEYIGAYLYTDYENKKKSDNTGALFSLDLACERGLFRALTERCSMNQEKIKTTPTPSIRKQASAQLLADTKMLGTLYGTIGYFHSSLVLLDIGNYYTKLNTEESKRDAKSFNEEAAKSFYAGKELMSLSKAELPQNKKLLKIICGEEDDPLKTFGLKEIYFKDHVDDKNSTPNKMSK